MKGGVQIHKKESCNDCPSLLIISTLYIKLILLSWNCVNKPNNWDLGLINGKTVSASRNEKASST